jgi:hypothetical protein
MIDIFNAQKGDLISYQRYLCSESLKDEPRTGIYQGYTYWSPDGRPIELWVEVLSQEGIRKLVRASQIVQVYRKETL